METPRASAILMRRILIAAFVLVAAAFPAAAQSVRYYHLDGAGNVRAISDQNGNIVERHDYLPFGEECTTGPCASNPGVGAGGPRKFTGKERDTETGLDYFGARYYRSKIGRFTTVDPLLDQRAALVNPQRWNRYSYVSNNPFRYVDHDGREQVVIMNGRTYMGGVDGLSAGNEQAREQLFNVVVTTVSLAATAGAGFAAGGARQAAKEVVIEALENITGVPVGGLTSKPTRGGENLFTAAGRRAHAEEPLPPGFERDVRLPSGRRMDGYNAAEKEVLELKPDNQRAVRRGERQVEGYCRECDQTYGPEHSGRVQTYDQKRYLEKEKN